MSGPKITCGHDWMEGISPGNGLICILSAGHTGSHLACRESDLFGDTSNSDAVKFLRNSVTDMNALIETLRLNPPGISMHEKMKPIVTALEETNGCNCDLDNWEPEALTGHSWVCRIHIKAVAELNGTEPVGKLYEECNHKSPQNKARQEKRRQLLTQPVASGTTFSGKDAEINRAVDQIPGA